MGAVGRQAPSGKCLIGGQTLDSFHWEADFALPQLFAAEAASDRLAGWSSRRTAGSILAKEP